MSRPLTMLFAALALSSALSAQTVTVTTVEDVVDVPGTASFGDLPGPDGRVSFREALLVTNNTPGAQTVAFAIPETEWWFDSAVATLRLEDGTFFVSDDETTLDFGSQTTFTGDTNSAGREVGIFGLQPNGWGLPAIVINASHCEVRGLGPVALRTPAVEIQGGTDNRIVDCVTTVIAMDPYPGTTHGNVVGGTLPGEANMLEGVEMFCGANDNIVIGNQLEYVSVVGSQYCLAGNQYPERNRIGGPTPEERNVLSGVGEYGFEGFPLGDNIKVDWARDTVVEGNYVGVTPDGLTRVPQIGPTGIRVVDSVDTTIRDNLVAGMRVVGVNHYDGDVFGQALWIGALNQDNHGVTVQGNLIGTDVTGSQPITTYNGIRVLKSTGFRTIDGVLLGGDAPDAGNVIAFTELSGVTVEGSNVFAELRGNSIHDNGLLGIDLGSQFQGPDGVTPNDALDADSNGGNALQNFPELAHVMRAGDDLLVGGTLHSTPSSAFTLEFFGSPSCDASGFGEGELPLGTVLVNTDAAGDANFDVTLADVALPEGWHLTATATDDALGATSEFSGCVAAVWHDEGHALAGLDGMPRLVGSGDLIEGSDNVVVLSAAAPNTLAALLLALADNPQPFKGGVLVPLPSLLAPKLRNIGPAGTLALPFEMPSDVPSGTELWLQWVIVDGAAAQGVALSNALMGRAP